MCAYDFPRHSAPLGCALCVEGARARDYNTTPSTTPCDQNHIPRFDLKSIRAYTQN
nr:MAG TPA: hypothetical protein [Caudoviricetes sp.]